MRKVEGGIGLLTAYLSLWIATSHAKTFISYGIRLSETCKGFQILEDTNITCTPCSTMCLVQLKSEESFQPESQGVLVHDSDKQCSQISIETGQVFCFEHDSSNEETITILDSDRVTGMSVTSGPYIAVVLNSVINFAPIVDPNNSLPTFVAPNPPTSMDNYNVFAMFNHGLILFSGNFDKCHHWSFRDNVWNTVPLPEMSHGEGGTALLGKKLIIVGGREINQSPTDTSEILDPDTHLWSYGPKLPLGLRLMTMIQVSSNTIILTGGYNAQPRSNTYLLSSGDTQWTKLDDRPEPVYQSGCGVVVLSDGRRGALSIGGETGNGFSTEAYFLDFASMTWSHLTSFSLSMPSFSGFLFQTDTEIHYMPLCEHNFTTLVFNLYVRKTYGPNETWESRPYPLENFTILNRATPLTPTIYTIPIN